MATPTNLDETPRSNPPVKVNTGENDSMRIAIIASSIGASFFFLLLLVVVSLVLYYHFVLKPKHKILPEGDGRGSPSQIAWTREQEEIKYNIQSYEKPETPPPAFWDVHPLT